ncbi:copper chaperone PCu(A)C [Rhodophyticola sp. CCM32]|uniref:copper chaperone PCu(A)C n=1 Tax=Rhodophyticola sp. CCM32 TaxID=2916397 RepID=UPI00107EF414|nr:copper chaperone PCu(A)C [Rhodophyticola sp. CCM32]QBY01078.1 copper chaperone PCu(A)C [Rhodophyticola sp. CCM32]
MSIKTLALAVTTSIGLVLPGLVQAHMIIEDAYARSSSAVAQSGAAFMTITNHSDTDDRVVAVTSDAADHVELHTHLQDSNGVMRMIEVEDGFPVAAGQTIALMRGGDHIMFMGLTDPFIQGEELEVTISFEHAEPVTLMIPVDLERQDHGGMNHGEMDHSNMNHGSDS